MQRATVDLRFAPELRFFLPPRHRHGTVRADHDGTASLGHVVQSLGVPLTEVGGLYTGGDRLPLAHRPRPGQRVEVAAAARPQALPPRFHPPRFLLDVHLGTLARRMRLLGIDTAYDNDRDDPSLLAQANAEHRVLLTRDRGLLLRRALRAGAHVRSHRPDEQLDDVLERFAPPLAPWTRCVHCNGPLAPVAKEEVAERIPAGTRATYDTFARCQVCRSVFWPGAHHDELTRIVARAAAPRTRP
ncbi:Mut7-C RNAse domain-containing protein [Nocardiopsis sp. LOL_012]|uniref:Mut7-C RNAse domain-containing protein n=1 Tax=Nocardiopsis sp. LOL_012 TaxID=3345409 RepID=UPI003A8386D0